MDIQLDKGGWLWIVAGPTACGKSTVAAGLARTLNFVYLEGDDYHPPPNVAKMHAGFGLTDKDRQQWLINLQNVCSRKYTEGTRYMAVSASLLKRQYRDRLREVAKRPEAEGLKIGFVFLDAPEEVLRDRAIQRHGHYAGGNLVHSQFEALEEPGDDEADVVRVDADQPIEVVSQNVTRKVADVMGLSLDPKEP